jgi:hypothetical protein
MKHKLKNIPYWSRKFHIHMGLFLIFFIVLFSFSGLLLNHGSKWKFASFWDERKEKITVVPIEVSLSLDGATLLKNILLQLRISGEVNHVIRTSDSLDFGVSMPGHERNLHVNLTTGTCTQKEIIFNGWGKMRTLRTFNGINRNDPGIHPNWIITRICQFTKDVLAISIIILCFSSWIMWYKIRKQYKWGILYLLLGAVISVFFIFH